ncbi:hypothetical protein [Roseivivax sediminis]|uniref:Uncharacterized protein n=1 Tax=Roseivivax sediminis TaxID=936889 RepID=A0A1I1SGG7_9RHOB|nr:hypothetical protein [Roseivivax sediminis]SFD43728.1 hypothetical protein SAMN04515678_10173 [Roseivivax sediminis]
MPRLSLSALLAALPGLAAAQDFAPRWEVLGTFEATVEGTDHTLYALADNEGGSDFVGVTEAGGFTVITVTAAAPGAGGQPAPPYLSATIGPFRDAPGDGAGIEWREGETAWFATSDSGTRADMSDVDYDGERLSFTFDAPELVALETDEDWNFIPVEGVAPVSASGTFEGRVPASD